jgi:hypothetical protein
MARPDPNTSTNPVPNRREIAELSALADGTLPPARRAHVEARISASAELSALYEREQRVANLLKAANARTGAPDALRARIERARPRKAVRIRQRAVYGAGLTATLAVIVLALLLVLPGGTPGGPSVSQASALALRGPAAAAPGPDRANPSVQLARAVGKTYFPNWARTFGWSGIGQRVDRIGGRLAITVFYASKGAEVAYTIVSGSPLAEPPAPITVRNGTAFRALEVNRRRVVTWRRSGHTCVLSAGPRIPAATLETLAAWKVSQNRA